MHRRGLSLALLALFAVFMLGSVALASARLDPCPDETNGMSCPPICVLCVSCAHPQTAIVQSAQTVVPIAVTQPFMPQQGTAVLSPLAAEIFHVPLLG